MKTKNLLGNDPATDLRGSGMLGLVHIIQFLNKNKTLILKIFQLSKDDRQVSGRENAHRLQIITILNRTSHSQLFL